ncbi:unnamed protein product, partial [Linum tenue]
MRTLGGTWSFHKRFQNSESLVEVGMAMGLVWLNYPHPRFQISKSIPVPYP